MENLTQQQTDRLKRSIKYWLNQMYKEYIDLDQFIESLEDWQDYLRKKANDQSKYLWFRFYNGDTLATTIKDLSKDLNPLHSTKENRELIKEKIFIALKENSLQINF